MTVVTRFAPSPTGSLHIGGARTALFSYLWARHNQGRFLLRIEDTDEARSMTAKEDQIISSLKWLGLDWDGDVWHQSQFAGGHRVIVDKLVDKGAAYRDYTPETELNQMRENWKRDHKGPFRYHSPWRDTHSMMVPNAPYVVRMKAPREGSSTVKDHVQGEVAVQNEQIEDFVIQRSDGSPTFLLAGVVDDHDMGVNWVIRGDDHLNNVFKQKLIYQALGWPEPEYAHIPLIHNAGGQKYSKRDGAAGVDEFAEDFVPDALFNYLLRLGWGHGNDEIISREQAVEWFDIHKVGKNPARFDLQKLTSINAHYLREKTPEAFAERIGLDRKYAWLMPEVQKRVHVLSDVGQYVNFLSRRPEPVLEELSVKVISYVERCDWTSADNLKDEVTNFCAAHDLKMRDVAHSIRWSLAGSDRSLSIFDMMVALGRDETIRRLLGNQYVEQPERAAG
jgi:glutamyl-tRNA synthetase